MEELLKNIDKMKALVIEYKNSIDYSKCKYHLVKDDSSNGLRIGQRYFFVSISRKEVLVNGNIERVRSYMNLRNINVKDVYMDDNDVLVGFYSGALKNDLHQSCPVCKSNNIRQDFDFKEMRSCNACGSDWHKDGDITLNAREIN